MEAENVVSMETFSDLSNAVLHSQEELAPSELELDKAFFGGLDPQKVLVTVKKRQPIVDSINGKSVVHKSCPSSYEFYDSSYTNRKTGILKPAQRNT